MDIQKERELCEVEFEKEWDSFCEAYGNGYNKSAAKYFFFEAWQAAKAQAVPDGFVIVPKRPTRKMMIAASGWDQPHLIYKAMIEAAQEPK